MWTALLWDCLWVLIAPRTHYSFLHHFYVLKHCAHRVLVCTGYLLHILIFLAQVREHGGSQQPTAPKGRSTGMGIKTIHGELAT